jgi:eukaryotic-like serine/threonine-protein kinase
MASPSFDDFSVLLGRSRLLPNEDLQGLTRRWRSEAQAGAGAEDYARWLAANQYLTDYQAGVLLRGRAGPFFLNEYKLLDRLGVGRMAGVFKAQHRLGQIVAVKVLPASKAKDPTTFARFQREARLAVRLNHPNVVRTFQTGEADGLHYIIMEYVEGETLEDVLTYRKRLPANEAVRIIGQALHGLQCLHEEGIVHRDLTPANLMLTPASGYGPEDDTLKCRVKILDIGLGRALFDDGETGVGGGGNLTTAGESLGSPDYMAPEQGRDAHSADGRADIYSLGCVLYHCLTARPPFPGGNAIQKVVRHATETPRPLRELNPSAPAGLQGILDNMLAKDPAQRYATPERALQDLRAFLVAEQAPEQPQPKMQEYLKWLAAREAAQPAAPEPPSPAEPPAAPAETLDPIITRASDKAPSFVDFIRSHLLAIGVVLGGILVVAIVVWLIMRTLLP